MAMLLEESVEEQMLKVHPPHIQAQRDLCCLQNMEAAKRVLLEPSGMTMLTECMRLAGEHIRVTGNLDSFLGELRQIEAEEKPEGMERKIVSMARRTIGDGAVRSILDVAHEAFVEAAANNCRKSGLKVTEVKRRHMGTTFMIRAQRHEAAS